jgi:NAD(P)-dependent dehydrogenase (short-subunit alcohol dehydrogenase family)
MRILLRSKPRRKRTSVGSFETNFWGVYYVSRAALPVLKRQESGIIVQFSSIGGRVGGTAGPGSYQAAKFAVDGFTRVLAAETAPFGIRCLTVEPGGFATDWAGASMEIQGSSRLFRIPRPRSEANDLLENRMHTHPG